MVVGSWAGSRSNMTGGMIQPASIVDLGLVLMYFESLSSFAGCVVGLSGKDAYVLEAEAVARGLDMVQHRRLLV